MSITAASIKSPRPIILILILFISCHSFSQFYLRIGRHKVDSLEKALNTTRDDRDRIDILNTLAEYYAWYAPERFDAADSLAMALSKTIGYPAGEGVALFNKGFKYYTDGDIQNAISYYQDAIRLLEKTDKLNALAKAYDRMGWALFITDTDKQKAAAYGLKAIDHFHRAGNIMGEASEHLVMGGVFFRIGKPIEGLESMQKYWGLRSSFEMPGFYDAIGYSVEGECYLLLGDKRKAIDYNLKALPLFDETNLVDRSLKSQIESITGRLYLLNSQVDSAIYFFRKALATGQTTQNAFQLMRSNLRLAKVMKEVNDLESAVNHCDSALFYANIIDSTGYFYIPDSLWKEIGMSEEIFFPISKSYRRYVSWEFMNQIYQLRWDVLNLQGKHNEATVLHAPWMKVRDSLAEYEKDRDLMELDISYETERKDQQLNNLSEENRLNELKLRQTRTFMMALMAFIIMTVLIAILLIRQNRMNARNKTIILEQRLLRAQMDPHFLFNSLSSIQGFMIEKDVRAANLYLSKFAGLIRSILDNSQEEFVLLVKEINTIRYYLELQQVRYENKFDFTISVDDALDTETMSIPPMLAQPFIENAIEHGMKHKNTKGHIQINFKLKDGFIVFEVMDNGIGRERSEQLKTMEAKGHKSLATTITRERIEVMNKKYRRKIRFEIIDLKDETGKAIGTKVEIRIPEDLHR